MELIRRPKFDAWLNESKSAPVDKIQALRNRWGIDEKGHINPHFFKPSQFVIHNKEKNTLNNGLKMVTGSIENIKASLSDIKDLNLLLKNKKLTIDINNIEKEVNTIKDKDFSHEMAVKKTINNLADVIGKEYKGLKNVDEHPAFDLEKITEAKNIKTVKIIVPNEMARKKANNVPTFKRLSRQQLKVGENIENVNHAQFADMKRLYPMIDISIEEIKLTKK